MVLFAGDTMSCHDYTRVVQTSNNQHSQNIKRKHAHTPMGR